MNTMLMTVFERKQEISVLLALGWKPSRIVRMVLWESALLGLLGGIAGVLIDDPPTSAAASIKSPYPSPARWRPAGSCSRGSRWW